MSKFYRNFMMVGVIALGLAACGDDLTITETPPPVIEIPPPPPPPAVPNITSFSVSPSAVSIAKGSFVQAAATLLTKPGVAGVVSWSSSSPSVATVDGSGKITAVSEGVAVVTATATADGETATAGIGVTVTPEGAKIVSFSVTPANASMVQGNVLQAQANLQTIQGVTGSIAWGSSNGAVASVNGNGTITAVAPGTATITATASAGGQTATQTVGITVRAVVPAQISINSVTQQANGLPVVLNAVAGQIEINTLFNPGEQRVDSLVVFIGGMSAAKQVFATNPAAGAINLSVNTAAYTVTPTAAVTSWKNGPTTISAAVYPAGASAPTATNTINIVLVNADGWMATLDDAPDGTAAGPGGLTYWGGPGAANTATYTLRPVTYTAGRSVTAVSWNVAGCNVNQGAATGYTRSFGASGSGANTSCNTEYTGGARHNVAVTSATDNAANPYPVGGMIPNATIFGSTPDSVRFDWVFSGGIQTPTVVGSEGFNWINASWTFNPAGTDVFADAGVGANGSSWKPFTTGTTTQVSSGADFAETNTNNNTDGYRLYATGADLLGNAGSTGNTAYFGVDKTAPSIRYASAGNLPSIYTQGGTTSKTDSTTYLAIQAMFAAGTTDTVQTESIDNRSGLSRSITTSRRFAQGGATGSTSNLGCSTNSGVFGAAYGDGWRPAPQVHISCGSAAAGYYTTSQQTVDRAGNTSGTYKRTMALDPAQPAVTGVSPNAAYTANAAAPFTIGAQDDLEVIDWSARLHYPGLTQGDAGATASPGLRYKFGGGIATRFDNSVINPVLATASIDRFTVSIQEVCESTAGVPGAACPAYAGDPVSQADIAVAKPDSIAATVRDVFGSFAGNITPGAATGVSAELASPILSATVPTPGFYTVGYDASTNCAPGGVPGGACVTTGINFRYFSTSGTTRTFRATQDQSITTPMFTMVELWGLNAAGEWEYISRCTVVQSGTSFSCAGTGSILGQDNGFERLWDFTLTGATGYSAYRAMGLNASGFGLFSNII